MPKLPKPKLETSLVSEFKFKDKLTFLDKYKLVQLSIELCALEKKLTRKHILTVAKHVSGAWPDQLKPSDVNWILDTSPMELIDGGEFHETTCTKKGE